MITNSTLCNILSRLDYGGISILIMGSSYPPIIYIFSCSQVHFARNCFLVLITSTSIGAFLMMMIPALNQPQWRTLRALTFIFLGLSAGFPFFYVWAADKRHFLPTQDCKPWLLGGFIYIGGALIYAGRFPERCFPIRFDICGASHQLFHLAVLFAFSVHFKDALRLY